MKIAVIQASSQAEKNELIYSTVKKYASGCDVINFGCTKDETIKYSYIEISVLVGLLLASGAVDFVVTGCSSGQGMMLACVLGYSWYNTDVVFDGVEIGKKEGVSSEITLQN